MISILESVFKCVTVELLGSSFKHRPPAKLLVFCETDQSDIYQIMMLSSRFGALCTALEKLLRSIFKLEIRDCRPVS